MEERRPRYEPSAELRDGRIQSISSVVNPDKLRHVGPLGDVRAFLRRSTCRD